MQTCRFYSLCWWCKYHCYCFVSTDLSVQTFRCSFAMPNIALLKSTHWLMIFHFAQYYLYCQIMLTIQEGTREAGGRIEEANHIVWYWNSSITKTILYNEYCLTGTYALIDDIALCSVLFILLNYAQNLRRSREEGINEASHVVWSWNLSRTTTTLYQ